MYGAFFGRTGEPEYEDYLEAVEQDGMALEIVPDEMMNERMCRTAVQSDVLAIFWIPEKKRTPLVCVDALLSAYDHRCIERIWEEVPEEAEEAVKELLRRKRRFDCLEECGLLSAEPAQR